MFQLRLNQGCLWSPVFMSLRRIGDRQSQKATSVWILDGFLSENSHHSTARAFQPDWLAEQKEASTVPYGHAVPRCRKEH